MRFPAWTAHAPLCFAALLAACASDGLPEPEADIDDPGAFIAVDDGDGQFTLERTLGSIYHANDLLISVTVYDVRPRSWDEAKQIAMGHDIPIRLLVAGTSAALLAGVPHRVVWFRTLTDEEEGRQ